MLLALLICLALGGVALIWYCTPWGAGLMDDAFIYIVSARNLAAGHGLTWPWGDGSLQPLTHFPPFFPLVLAGFKALGVDATLAARLVNALLFGASIFMVGWMLEQGITSLGYGQGIRSHDLRDSETTHEDASPRYIGSKVIWANALPMLFALLGAALILTSDVLIEAHSWALSESLYLFLTLLGLYGLARYMAHWQSRKWLVTAALALGLAFLTRYIGLSLIIAGLVALLLQRNVTWRRRILDMLWFGLVGMLPIALWVARNLLLTHSLTDRAAEQHLITLKQLLRLASTILAWFIPGRLVFGLELLWIVGLVLLGVLLAFLMRRTSPPSPPLHGVERELGGEASPDFAACLRSVLVLQILFHIVVLVVSKSYFDVLTPLNDRILSPILPSLLILLVLFLADLAGKANQWQKVGRWVRLGVLSVSVVFLGFYAYRAADLVPRLHDTGLGFARKGWHRSETLQTVRVLPAVPLYSNSPGAIYMWTERPAYPIYSPEQMRQDMRQKGARLVLFNSISVDLYDVTLEELTEGLTVEQQFKDGVIYKLAQ